VLICVNLRQKKLSTTPTSSRPLCPRNASAR